MLYSNAALAVGAGGRGGESHFDELLVTRPLVALAMGLALAVIWGLPPTLLALRRDLESAIGFHWIQDVLRFLAGF